MTDSEIWSNEERLTELDWGASGFEVPEWIDEDISPSTIAAIVEGGCASGAYMPAVTYYDALNIMRDYGDDVLDYLESAVDGPFAIPAGESWGGIAVFFLSTAVELWAFGVYEELTGLEEEGL